MSGETPDPPRSDKEFVIPLPDADRINKIEEELGVTARSGNPLDTDPRDEQMLADESPLIDALPDATDPRDEAMLASLEEERLEKLKKIFGESDDQ